MPMQITEDCMLEENEDLIKDDKIISNLFSDFFVNVIEHSKDKKPTISSKDKSLTKRNNINLQRQHQNKIYQRAISGTWLQHAYRK